MSAPLLMGDERSRKTRGKLVRRAHRLPQRTRLVANFSEFLESRNVMRTGGYNKMLAGANAKRHHLSHKERGGKRALALIRALLSPHQQRSRTSLLVSLLRAPAVLAALFSLLLTVTLLVLYTMSFAHHHLPSAGSASNQSVSQLHRRHLAQNEATNQVETECGTFAGEGEDALAFTGIPYASAPLGPMRWARPRPVWLDAELCHPGRPPAANQGRQHCAQLSPVTRRFSGHEDCLYLDVYAPAGALAVRHQLGPTNNRTGRLPVLVYIHGGFLAHGSSGQGQVNWLSARPSAQLASGK